MQHIKFSHGDNTQLPKGAYIAIGNFDGVHRGHQSVIRQAVKYAKEQTVASAVLTFEPHPYSYFSPSKQHFHLSSRHMKKTLIERLGVDTLYELTFDTNIAKMSAEKFVEEILGGYMGISGLVAGCNFRYGKDRAGSMASLITQGKTLGISVAIAPPASEEGQLFSSSSIRAALGGGDTMEAARQLGRFHMIDGIVVDGDKRGRTFGFPTANLSLEGFCRPAFGIYAGYVEYDGGKRHPSVISIGVRPTYVRTEPILEAYIFDFSENLYGKRIFVSLIGFLRPEKFFASTESLIAQMREDATQARILLDKIQAEP